ncbi:DUF2178 domain-containing protein [Tepidibacter sp. Z1-5]|uniref:DUF2178 domain-containing protein n=1 Tax=Tepidibacter sp. Z1-5 TaxID=3134138 RepID=UPI0030C0808D
MSKSNNQKQFVTKILYFIIITMSIVSLALYLNLNSSYIIGLLFGLLGVFTIITLKNYKEIKSPTYSQDERNLSIAYKSESISFRICVFVLALISILAHGNNFFETTGIEDLSLFMIFAMLISKITIYYILQKKY